MAKALRVLPFGKASEGVFYSSASLGLLSGPNTRVPKEEELMVINIDSSEQSKSRLWLQSAPRATISASPNLKAAISVSPNL